jgi:hypothetical protein
VNPEPGSAEQATSDKTAVYAVLEALALMVLADIPKDQRIDADEFIAITIERFEHENTEAAEYVRQGLMQALDDYPALRLLDHPTVRRQALNTLRWRLNRPACTARPSVVRTRPRTRRSSGSQRRRTPARGSSGRSSARLAAGDDDPDEPPDVARPLGREVAP